MTELATPDRIGLCYTPVVPGAEALARELHQLCGTAGRDAWVDQLPDPVEGDSNSFAQNVANSDLLVCVGGDGTVLHASEHAAAGGTPVFGVRMGRLGFLSESTSEEAAENLATVLRGGCRLERRSTVQARVNDDEPVYALNDVVIGRSTLGRTVSVGARVDGVLVAEYRADAIVLATATGSTGYSLSVGGPILEPTSAELIIVPVAPHLTRSNALVLPPTSEVHLYVERGYEAMITVDGLHERPLDAGSTVVVSHSDRVVDFVRLGSPSQFYSNLADRLGWLRADHVLDQSQD